MKLPKPGFTTTEDFDYGLFKDDGHHPIKHEVKLNNVETDSSNSEKDVKFYDL